MLILFEFDSEYFVNMQCISFLSRIYICDSLSENSTSLHNSVLDRIEIHWVKNAYYKNNFMRVLIASVKSDTRLQ